MSLGLITIHVVDLIRPVPTPDSHDLLLRVFGKRCHSGTWRNGRTIFTWSAVMRRPDYLCLRHVSEVHLKPQRPLAHDYPFQ